MKGIFITFEGIDGSGKTTQIKKLYNFLKEQDYNVMLTREPGGTAIGDRIRDILLDKKNKDLSFKAETLLFEASRAELTSKKIIPALKSGKIVICDRFFDSTIVYQGIARGLGIKEVYDLSLWTTGGLEPDLTFLLSLGVSDSERRIDLHSRKRDRIEHEKNYFKEQIQKGYLNIAKKFGKRFIVINGNRDVDSIFSEIKERTLSTLKAKTLPGKK